jgi:hypothetical protein
MASPPIPPLPDLPFSFYPAIRDIEHNEWLFRKATWSELVVVNRKTGLEISIPRRFWGEVSTSDHPVIIVGLLRELQYKDGAVWPYQRRVIEMPVAVGESFGPAAAPKPRRESPAPVIGIRLESRRDRRPFRWLGGSLAVALLLHGVVSSVIHFGEVKQRPYLDLSGRDDYTAVVRKLGKPSSDHNGVDSGHPYRALGYRRFTVILLGPRYIGTMDSKWRPVHSVDLPPAGTSYSLLRSLKRF